MTESQFRKIALAMPEAVEVGHMGHPDFRVGGKIFATLFSRDGTTFGMVKLNVNQQKVVLRSNPETFAAIPGGWGKHGATQVLLATSKPSAVKSAVIMAWRNTAPMSLVAEHGLSEDDRPVRKRKHR